jgi:flagellar biosynthetic protein FlhB
MSDEEKSKEDKTEDPSPRKLDQARKKGQVVVGKDAVGAAGLLACVLSLIAIAEPFRLSLVNVTRGGIDDLMHASAPHEVVTDFLTRAMWPVMYGLLPVVATAGGIAAATLLQTQGGFWPDKVVPDITKVFSKERVTKPFKLETLVDILLAFVKLLALVFALKVALGDAFLTIPRSIAAAPEGMLGRLLGPVANASAAVLVVMGGLAAMDYGVTRKRLMEQLKMTKDEIKREMKEELGDPHIKGARKRKHRELAEARVSDVPLADALVVNPIHFAVAIRYRKDESGAPRVIAKGKDAIALKMRELAEEHRVPIYKDVPLARLLHKKVKVGQPIPADTYQAVATVLAWVFKVTGRVPGTGPAWPTSPEQRDRSTRRRRPKTAKKTAI